MNPTHFDIQPEIRDLGAVVEQRLEATAKNKPREAKHALDLLVCVRSRSLFSRFADTALWPGVDGSTLKAVREALQSAYDCLNQDKGHAEEKCLVSLENRVETFDEFVAEHL